MKIVFYSALKPREDMLAKALADGARNFGDTLEIRHTGQYGETLDGEDRKYPGPTDDTDVACCFGVKGRSKQILKDHLAVGKATLFFDKGYTRDKGEGGHTLYSRISVNGPDPTAYMMRVKRDHKRWAKLSITLRDFVPRRGGHILICGSSEKYHAFHSLPPPAEYAAGMVSRLLKMCDNQIIYRPKPSSTQKQIHTIDTEDIDELREALEHYDSLLIRNKGVGGAALSGGETKIFDALRGAYCVVTHGSAAAMDAVINGVPVMVLGGSIAKPVATTELDQIGKVKYPQPLDLRDWTHAVAYCQWTVPELRNGEAWSVLRDEIVHQQQTRKK